MHCEVLSQHYRPHYIYIYTMYALGSTLDGDWKRIEKETYINSLQAAFIAELSWVWGWLRLLEFMHCIVYCIAAYLPRWGYAISQIYTAYIVRLPFNAIPQLAEVSLNNRLYLLPYTICDEMATRFIRIFSRSHDLSDIHLDTLETRHSVTIIIVSFSVSVSGSHRNSTGPN